MRLSNSRCLMSSQSPFSRNSALRSAQLYPLSAVIGCIRSRFLSRFATRSGYHTGGWPHIADRGSSPRDSRRAAWSSVPGTGSPSVERTGVSWRLGRYSMRRSRSRHQVPGASRSLEQPATEHRCQTIHRLAEGRSIRKFVALEIKNSTNRAHDFELVNHRAIRFRLGSRK